MFDFGAIMKMVNENPTFLTDLKESLKKWGDFQEFLMRETREIKQLCQKIDLQLEALRKMNDPTILDGGTLSEILASNAPPREQSKPLFEGAGDGVRPDIPGSKWPAEDDEGE